MNHAPYFYVLYNKATMFYESSEQKYNNNIK